MLLTRLGVPRLWGEDPDEVWPHLRRYVSPVVVWLAPSSAYGVERVPPEGGVVVVANHLSAIDPALVGAMSPRPLVFMAKAELLEIPIAGELIQFAGAFPVRRGESDRDAVRRARALVHEGRALGMFVEGTRQRLGHPGEVRPGALMIALQEGAPIVPCGVESFGWTARNRRPCAVVWGETLDVTGLPRSSRGYREAAEIVRGELVRLWRLAAEAVAAGFPPVLEDGSMRRGRIRADETPASGRVAVVAR